MVSVEVLKNNIMRITLGNNPVNAISIGMLKELNNVLDDIDFSKVRCLYFDSSVDHFCAGADLKERSLLTNKETISFLDQINKLFHRISHMSIPTFAFINGACLGGGLEFALSCDFRIAYNNSFFGFPETSIGIIPGAGGTQRLTRLVGSSKSLKWIFSANKFKPQEALHDGVVDFLIENNDKDKFISTFVTKIAKNAPKAVSAAKNSINAAFIDYGFISERKEYLTTLYSDDRNEGLRSFKEKRSPEWKNK